MPKDKDIYAIFLNHLCSSSILIAMITIAKMKQEIQFYMNKEYTLLVTTATESIVQTTDDIYSSLTKNQKRNSDKLLSHTGLPNFESSDTLTLC